MNDVTLTLTHHQLVELALAVSAAAAAAYCDERLGTAAEQYAMAAQLWARAGHADTAREKLAISWGVRNEIVANARELEDV